MIYGVGTAQPGGLGRAPGRAGRIPVPARGGACPRLPVRQPELGERRTFHNSPQRLLC